MSWNIRLEGGPADGDHAICEGEPPTTLWVAYCHGHKDWHWFLEAFSGCEVYHRDEYDFEAMTASFVYEEMGLLTGFGRETEALA